MSQTSRVLQLHADSGLEGRHHAISTSDVPVTATPMHTLHAAPRLALLASLPSKLCAARCDDAVRARVVRTPRARICIAHRAASMRVISWRVFIPVLAPALIGTSVLGARGAHGAIKALGPTLLPRLTLASRAETQETDGGHLHAMQQPGGTRWISAGEWLGHACHDP